MEAINIHNAAWTFHHTSTRSTLVRRNKMAKFIFDNKIYHISIAIKSL